MHEQITQLGVTFGEVMIGVKLRAWKSGPDHLPSVTRHPPKPPYKIDSLLEQHIHLTHLTHRARTELQIRLSPQHSNY